MAGAEEQSNSPEPREGNAAARDHSFVDRRRLAGSLKGRVPAPAQGIFETVAAKVPEKRVEPRRHPRYIAEGNAEIVVQNGASLFRGRILNISESGCYIQTLASVRLPRFTLVEILFVVSGKMVSLAAEARTSTPKVGIGFQFLPLDRHTRGLLNMILASLDPDSGSSAPNR